MTSKQFLRILCLVVNRGDHPSNKFLVADQTDEFIDLNDPGTRLCIVGIKV